MVHVCNYCSECLSDHVDGHLLLCHVIEIIVISHATPSEYSEETQFAQLIFYMYHVNVWNVHFQPFSNAEFGSSV